MRFQITKYECPELFEKQQVAEKYAHDLLKFDSFIRGDTIKRFTYSVKEKNVVYFCKSCGAELYGTVKYTAYHDCKELSKTIDQIKYAYVRSAFRYSGDKDVCALNALDNAFACAKEVEKLAEQVEIEANAEYEKTVKLGGCPICGAQLSHDKGFFLPDWEHFSYGKMFKNAREEMKQQYGTDSWALKSYTRKFEAIAPFRDPADRAQAISDANAYAKSCNRFVTESVAARASEIKKKDDELKNYILHLIRLENNIYSLEQQLSELYYQRAINNRAVVLSVHEPAYTIKMELENLQAAYQKSQEAVEAAKAYHPVISVDYPNEPPAPVLGKPGLFNKKKVLEENEALTAKYQVAMEIYKKEVQRCDEEKVRLFTEACAAVVGEAQKSADAAEMALREAESNVEGRIKEMEARPVSAKAAQKLLDRDIAEAEELLKKTFSARNELYAYDIIFGKYRNVVALSSFYEYLMSGRCSTLEGADGAYNIYESEVRANRIIAQLDTVVSSLEDIKQNQYMMYEELRSIKDSLGSLNYTMDKALASISSIEANTMQMNEYMECISKNSDVIAHNTAVTAYYSKVNAELTNALGYMVAFS